MSWLPIVELTKKQLEKRYLLPENMQDSEELQGVNDSYE